MADWLWISVQTGEKKPFDPYLIPNGQPSRRSQSIPAKKQQPAPQDERKSVPRGNLDVKTQPLKKDSNGLHKTNAIHPPEKDSSGKSSSGSESHDDDTTAPPLVEPFAEPVTASEKAQSNSPLKPSPTGSVSASKDVENNLVSGAPHPPREESNVSSTSGPLGIAISELLKQKRQSSKNPVDNAVGADGRRTNKRRPLLGRANSLASGRAVTTIGPGGHSNGISRAGSIDSLNDDGCGSVIGSVIDETDNQSNHGKNNAQSFSSVLTANSNMDNGLNVYHPQRSTDPFYDDGTGLGEGESPHMTQLGYDDPDAAAMREKITKQSERAAKGSAAGKSAASKGQKKTGGVVLGEVRDLESLGGGWGGGRRTRRGRGGALDEGL